MIRGKKEEENVKRLEIENQGITKGETIGFYRSEILFSCLQFNSVISVMYICA